MSFNKTSNRCRPMNSHRHYTNVSFPVVFFLLMVKLLVVVLLFSFYLLAFGYWTKVKSNVMPFFDWFSIILIIAKNHNHFFVWLHVGACVYQCQSMCIQISFCAGRLNHLKIICRPFDQRINALWSHAVINSYAKSFAWNWFLFACTTSKCIEMKRKVRIVT